MIRKIPFHWHKQRNCIICGALKRDLDSVFCERCGHYYAMTDDEFECME